jgi:3',5'-nucleoside bisphosphate phosphatase
MLKWYRADLHVHTCLSPCGELTMSPRRIVAESRKHGVDLIAVTDHNSAANAAAVMAAATGTTVAVLPGLELCSREEVHVLALFDEITAALTLQEEVYAGITALNDPDLFGEQVIVNAGNEVEGFEPRLLIGAANLSIDEIVRRVHALGGVAIAAHIDRESFGIIGHLGFVPPGLALDALEVSTAAGEGEIRRLSGKAPGMALIRGSDAHTPERIGEGVTRLLVAEPTCVELGRALHGGEGRQVASLLGEDVTKWKN